MLSNLIILSDLLHHLVHHFHIKPHHFMIQYTTLPFFKILQNTSKYKVLRSYINLWKSIIRKSINSCLYCSIISSLFSPAVRRCCFIFNIIFYSIINVFPFQCVFGTLNLHIKICSSKSYVCFSWLSGSRKSLKPTNHYQVNNSAASCLLPQHTFNPYISVLLLQKYQQSPSLSASLTNVLKNAKHIEHMFVLCYNTYSYFRYHYFSIW